MPNNRVSIPAEMQDQLLKGLMPVVFLLVARQPLTETPARLESALKKALKLLAKMNRVDVRALEAPYVADAERQVNAVAE